MISENDRVQGDVHRLVIFWVMGGSEKPIPVTEMNCAAETGIVKLELCCSAQKHREVPQGQVG